MPPSVVNNGNLVTRRAFADTDRMKVLRRVVNKAMSTAYQMTEEVGEYGSGTPSPLHMVCDLVAELYEIESREGAHVSHAQEMADYPALYLALLRGGATKGADAPGKLNFLMKSAADANFLVKGRTLAEMSVRELKEFAGFMANAAVLARELAQLAETQIGRHAEDFPGAPVQAERLRATG